MKPILIAVTLVVAMLCSTGVASASTFLLSQVGPELTASNVKTETQEMLRHDQGIQNFLSLNSSAAQGITVTKTRRFTCEVGVNPLCGINTGKNGSGNLEETRYRFGTFVEAYEVHFTYNGKTYEVTFEQKCSNLLSGRKQLKGVKKIVVSKTKPIKFNLVINVSATATCNGASSSASLHVVPLTAHSWSAFFAAISAGSVDITASCTSPPSTPPASTPPSSIPPAPVQECNQSGWVLVGGSCVNAQQHCELTNNGTWNGSANLCTVIVIIANCSNVTVLTGTGEIVNQHQEGNCNIEVEKEKSTPPPVETCPAGTVGTPPNCKEAPYPFNLEPPEEFYPNETGVICTNIHAPYGDTLKVYFHAKYGHFTETQAFPSSAYSGENSFCETYKASSDYLSQGDKYWVQVLDTTTGLSGPSEKEATFEVIPMKAEEVFY